MSTITNDNEELICKFSALNFAEILFLLCLNYGEGKNGMYPVVGKFKLEATGIESIDHGLLSSLFRKKTLIDENNSNQHKNYKPSKNAILKLSLEEIHVDVSTIYSALKDSATTYSVEKNDIKIVENILTEIQLRKLYQLLDIVSTTFSIPLEKSNPLQALLFYLAKNYAPQNMLATFEFVARKTAVNIHKNNLPFYRAKHIFTKILGTFIHSMERRELELDKAKDIPTEISISPFEGRFCELFLASQFNFNRLSQRQGISHWLNEDVD